jgi:hypothetical protein
MISFSTRSIRFIFICLIFNSCLEILKTTQLKARDEKNKHKIYLGMSKEEFYSLYPCQFFYENQKPFMHVSKALLNPYKVEIRLKNEIPYEVIYIYTNPSKLDNVIEDHELTPYIFKGNNLIEIGWDSFNSLFFKK